MHNFTELSVPQAIELIQDQQPMILDARDTHAYKDGHIEGAMQAHQDLINYLVTSNQFERPVLVYCYLGNASKDIASTLAQAGYKHCYSLKGGFTAWKKHKSSSALRNYSASTAAWLEKNEFDLSNINVPNPKGVFPAILACQQGNVPVIKDLIACNVDLTDSDNSGNGVVWAACYSGNTDILECLVSAGANVNAQNPDGVSPLMYAASAGKTEVVKYLVEHGADTSLETLDGFTALDLAANLPILKFLRKHSLVEI